MPTLRLLVTMREPPSLDRINWVARSKALEDLIIQKILMPSRALFFNSKNHSNADSSDGPTASNANLLAPLAKVYDTKAGEGFKETKTLNEHWPTSVIFQIALQSLARSTPKQRSVEDSWLQDLFYRILQQAFQIGAADALLKSSTQHLLSINQILQVIADHNIRINVSKLEPLLAHIMRSPDGTLDASVVCETINLCILIDANIFIGQAPIFEDIQRSHHRVPNQRLAMLLVWITNSAWKNSLEMDLVYEDKLSKVVSPLVEAYAKVRSLLSFVTSWQEQLVLCQKQRFDHSDLVARFYRPQTIWEDERLIQLIARLAESTLTAGQIKNLLLDAHTSVLSHENLGPDGYPNLMAKLILLDCAFGINLNDANSEHIKDVAQDIYHSSFDWILNKKCWPSQHKWRLWRILIAITKRWNVTENQASIQNLKQQVIGKAVELSTRARLGALRDENNQTEYAEELYAFAFVISSISGQNEPGEHESKLSHSLIETVIEWISSYATREKNDERQDQMASAANSKSVVQWDGQSDGVVSLDILHLCYLAQFLIFPGVFQLDKPSLDS